MARLELKIIGRFAAILDGNPITTFKSNKVRALLAYLATGANQPHRREDIAALIWPDWPAQSALSNLRYALVDLRNNIADRQAQPPFLLISRETIQFNLESDTRVDILEFEKQIFLSEQLSSVVHLESAVDLYNGTFMEGFFLPDSAPFEEWLTVRREAFKRQMMQALHGLAEYHQQNSEFQKALPYAYRQVEIEPWREESHQQVMRLLALSGQRSAALAQFETCRQSLKNGLDVAPAADTVHLYEAIRDGTFAITPPEQPSLDMPPAPGIPPFKGLQYFDEADAALFFGREALTARLVYHILEMVTCQGEGEDSLTTEGSQGSCCFLAVVGASGSGKSSLVRAGLVPALETTQAYTGMTQPSGQPRWQAHIITPTAHPLEALALSLTRGSESVTAAATLVDDMTLDPRSLHFYIKRLLSHPAPHPLPEKETGGQDYFLLVIDQFEELFTLCRSEAEQSAFLENLMNAARGPALVAIALRADFYAHCAQFPRLRQALSTRQEYIGPMTAEELRRTIEEPARMGGWQFEPGLVDLILREAGSEPGALPLLEHALLETWKRRSGRTLTLMGYAAAGGVQGAIARTAESVYGRLTAPQQALARRIFLRLTELGEGTQDTRRRAGLQELASQNSTDAPLLDGVLKILADARLITLAEGTAEVAHEALIREWPALRTWLSEDREGLRLHHRLTETTQAWAAMRRDPGELYRGARLVQALEWVTQAGHAQELNPLEQEFLSAAQALSAHETAELDAQRQRELETARKLVETEQRRAGEQAHSAQKLRRRAVYLAGALGIAILMVAVAVFFGWSADRQATAANTRQFAFAALANLAVDPGQSITQALQSIQLQPSVEAYSALHQALFTNHLLSSVIAQQGEVYGIAVNPAGDRLATVGTDQVINIWHLNGAFIEQPPVLSFKIKGLDQKLFSEFYSGIPALLAFSPDGKFLATIDADGYIIILDAQTGELFQRACVCQGDIEYWSNLAFSPDGNAVVAVNYLPSNGGHIGFWDLKTRKFIGYFPTGVTTVAFSPDGQRLASGGLDLSSIPVVTVYDVKGLNPDSFVPPSSSFSAVGEEGINSVRFSPDGRHLVFTTPNAAHVLDLAPLSTGGSAIETLRIPLENQFAAAYYLQTSQWMITAYAGGKINVWDVEHNKVLFKLLPELPVTAAAPSPDGRVFFTAYPNGEVRTWNVSSPGSPEWLSVPTGGVSGGIVLSADGSRLLGRNLSDAARGQWDVSLWQINGSQAAALDGYILKSIKINSVLAINPRLSRIALVDLSLDIARIFDAANGGLINELQLGPGINDFLIDADGSKLFVSRSYGYVDVWDIATARQLYSSKVANVTDLQGQTFFEVLSMDGSLLLTWGDHDPFVRLLKAGTGQFVRAFTGSDGTLCRPAITPDNQWLLTCGQDQAVMVWDVTSGKLARTIKLPGVPNLVQVTPDQRFIVASLISSQTVVYDFKTSRQVDILPGSSAMVSSAGTEYQFSPDGKYILMTIPGDQTAYGFVLDNNQLVKLACDRLASVSLPVSQGGTAQLPICKTNSGTP